MARGIFQRINGIWKRVIAPSYKDGSDWKSVQKGFVKKDGVWRQFYPSDVVAKILVVGGGGGGGVGYGMEGGGGGGAGGVVFKENQTLSVLSGNNYTIKVGTGGGANESGTYSLFGTGGITLTNTVSPAVYAGTYPVYNGFLNTYGVWTHPGMSGAAPSTVSATYTTQLQIGQDYTLRVSADNAIDVSIDGNGPLGSNSDWGSYNDSRVTLSAGTHTITCTATNWGGPAMFAAALYNPQGQVVWDTRAPINYPTMIVEGGITALGGGNGGWGTPEQTVGSGASGGGGCGYVYTHDGGAGYPGQGYPGGVGIWQGFGQAGGGGGGGFAGAGQGSNGNTGGAGGPGITLLGFTVGGGGGGGGGISGGFGSGTGGAGGPGPGGGGVGNGGNAQANTGGGGGGGLFYGQTSGGRGGDGIVVVQYPGAAAFTGGTITYDNGITTHVFASSGTLTAIG